MCFQFWSHRQHSRFLTIFLKKSQALATFLWFWCDHNQLAQGSSNSLNFHSTYQEKAMATHSRTLAWKIPWMEEPGRLQSMGSQRVRHDWATSLSLFTFMHWRRKWQPTPVFLPGESQGWGSLGGCCLSGRAESDTTEATQQQQHPICEGSALMA